MLVSILQKMWRKCIIVSHKNVLTQRNVNVSFTIILLQKYVCIGMLLSTCYIGSLEHDEPKYDHL